MRLNPVNRALTTAGIMLAGCISIAVAATSTTTEPRPIGMYDIPGGKSVRLTIPDGWQEKIESPGPNAPVTAQFSSPSNDAWIFLVSVLFDPLDQGKFDRKYARRTVKESAERSLSESAEKKIDLVEIEGAAATGYYFRATDNKATLGPEDYRYMIQGMVTLGPAGMTFTLLTNADDSALIDSALGVVRRAQVVSAAAQSSGDVDMNAEGYVVKLPGKSWSVSISIPGFKVVRDEAREDGGMTVMMATNDETGVNVSMFLEREKDLPASVECRARYFDRALGTPSRKSAVKRWETESFALGQYLIAEAEGIKFRQMHVNAYRGIEDVCLDIHLSKVRFEESERGLFETLIDSVEVVPLDAAPPR